MKEVFPHKQDLDNISTLYFIFSSLSKVLEMSFVLRCPFFSGNIRKINNHEMCFFVSSKPCTVLNFLEGSLANIYVIYSVFCSFSKFLWITSRLLLLFSSYRPFLKYSIFFHYFIYLFAFRS